MEVFNKLYSQVSSSVSNTVSQLSTVLPGNPVTREFDATHHIASGGPGLLWKIYKGYKRSTKQEASIFVLEKRQLDKYNKSDKEMVLESLRRGIVQLTKIRHPRILIVQHPLEDSRESLAFATEPVFASLANILGETKNMPQPANLSDYKFHDIEIKYGLLQLGEGLTFLHNDVKLLHRNICLESVIINQQGSWKIFGFDFCVHNNGSPNQTMYPFVHYDFTFPPVMQPNLEYIAPEYILTETHTLVSDLFSLGMLAYVLYSINHQSLVPVKDHQQYRNRAQKLKSLTTDKLQCLPNNLKDFVKMLLNVSPDVRPDAHQFVKIPFFEDVGVKTLIYLDSLLQWDNLQKSQFYKGLPEALTRLPHRVKVQQVLPCLVRDLAQSAMVPFVLPNILDIAQHCTKEEYIKKILPHLKSVMKLINPIQILLIFLQRMELLLKLTPAEDIQQHVLPMLYRGLDGDTPQVHELCLSVLPTFAGLLDHSNVKNSLLPRIKKLCLSTSTLSVRVNCLLCIGKLLESLDKWLVIDEVLPFLPQIPSREPAVIMGILGIYKLATTHKKLGISKEIIATRVLPFLIPLCIENGLTLPQFNALVNLVKKMFLQVEDEHRSKLEQLNYVKDEQKALESMAPSVNEFFSSLQLAPPPSSLQDHERLMNQNQSARSPQNQTVLDPVPVLQNKIQPPVKNMSNTLSPIESQLWTNASNSLTSSNFINQNQHLNNNLLKENMTYYSSFNNTNQCLNNSQFSQANTFSSSQNFMQSVQPSPQFNVFPSQNVLQPMSSSATYKPENNSNNISLSKDEIMDFLK
ncbi:hypothetical protein FQA39_LY13239 [Lamprigera yunnana]|nr:hypothetical protein FQA39_LY13239 [Lamprigera yunnana]